MGADSIRTRVEEAVIVMLLAIGVVGSRVQHAGLALIGAALVWQLMILRRTYSENNEDDESSRSPDN